MKTRKREREVQSEFKKRFRFAGTSEGSRQQAYSTPGMSSNQRGTSQISSRASRLGGQFKGSTRAAPRGAKQSGG